MKPEKHEKFIISQKAILIRDNKVLILKSAEHVNIWDLPGGRIDENERAKEAFSREIEEETGIKKFENRGVVDYGIFISKFGRKAMVIVNLIENNKDEIVLSHEHAEIKWIREEEVEDYQFFFQELNEIIKMGFYLN